MKLFVALTLYTAGALSVYARLVSHVPWHGWLATVLGIIGIGFLEAIDDD